MSDYYLMEISDELVKIRRLLERLIPDPDSEEEPDEGPASTLKW